MRPMLFLLCTVAAVVPALAFAADVELESKIDQVTVFPDAAVVTRVAPLDLAAGASTLILRGLPVLLDPTSIRAEGTAEAAFAIGGIDVRATPGEARPWSIRTLSAVSSPAMSAKRTSRSGRQATW